MVIEVLQPIIMNSVLPARIDWLFCICIVLFRKLRELDKIFNIGLRLGIGTKEAGRNRGKSISKTQEDQDTELSDLELISF